MASFDSLDFGFSTMGFKATDVEQAFNEVQSTVVWSGMDGVVKAIAVFLVLATVVSAIHETMSKPGGWDMQEVVKHLFIGGFMIVFIGSFNFIINGANRQFAEMETKLTRAQSSDSYNLGSSIMEYVSEFLQKTTNAQAGEALGKNDSQSAATDGSILDIGSSILGGLSDIGTQFRIYLTQIIIWPIAFIGAIIYMNVYLCFLCGRYVFLLLLELVAPIATICLIHSNTRSYFYTWLKNLFVCHLMLPAYFLVNVMSDKLAQLAFSESYKNFREHPDGSALSDAYNTFGISEFTDIIWFICIILMMIVIKTAMLRSVSTRISNLF